MQRADLLDVTFLIPLRIDSPERKENIQMVIKFLNTRFITNISILEADSKEKVKCLQIDKKLFVKDCNVVFHHTKYRNQLARNATTPIIALWDTDIILQPWQIIEAIRLFRKDEADMVFPYNGDFYDTTPVIRKLYKAYGDIDILLKNKDKFFKPFGHFSVGGAVFTSRNAFIDAGMENENFYGWGGEDVERVKRWEILGFRIKWVDGPLFHLSHPRSKNSWYGTEELEKKSRGELIKICKMNKKSLKKYIMRFSWQTDNRMKK